MPIADLNDNLQGDYEITAKALTVFPVQAERSTRLTDTGALKMTDEELIRDLNDFNYELAVLLHRSELHKPDVAAALVTVAVMLAASDGCGPVEQGEAIFGFAEKAISRLADLTDPDQLRH